MCVIGTARLTFMRLLCSGGPERLVYMTHAWLAHLYIHCTNAVIPELHCPNASAVAAFTAAVQRRDIFWHALYARWCRSPSTR